MGDLARSPLAPAREPRLGPVAGVLLASAEAGIKYRGRPDLLLVAFPDGAAVAGVLTRSATASAPVEWCRAHLPAGVARGLVVNSGNANAFTGMKGRNAVEVTAKAAADALGCASDQVFLASTGVIGEPLETAGFESLIAAMAGDLAADRYGDAARAIMTTDTFPKLAAATAEIDGVAVTLNGIAKGSGMIAPDMATMLAFLFTDAPIAAPVLQELLVDANADSFNAITVDSDTSTSDTVLAFATGAAETRGVAPITEPGDRRLTGFRGALETVMRDLAHQVVRDGEGASKFITVSVTGAQSKASAKKIALAIANSPLVKTAIAGEDANWGRVVMAVGKAGEPADRDRLAIWFGDHRVAVKGERDPGYNEAQASAAVQSPEVAIRVDLGIGDGSAVVWTCDLTHGYISINADYRT